MPELTKDLVNSIKKSESIRKRKNMLIGKIERKLEILESIMINEAGKGKNKDGRTSKALRAQKQFEELQKRISFIQFHT